MGFEACGVVSAASPASSAGLSSSARATPVLPFRLISAALPETAFTVTAMPLGSAPM